MSTSSSTYLLPKVVSNSPLFECRLNSVTLFQQTEYCKSDNGGARSEMSSQLPPERLMERSTWQGTEAPCHVGESP